MIVITGHIGTAFSTKQPYLPMNIGFILFRGEAAVNILPVTCRYRNILRQLNKILGIAADRTGQMTTWPPGGDLHLFLHTNILPD